MSAKDQAFPPSAVDPQGVIAYTAGMWRWLAERYGRLAERSREVAREATARLFDELATGAREGAERLEASARERSGQPVETRPPPAGLLEEEVLHRLELWERRPELATPYDVLAVAVRLQDALFRLCAGLGGAATTPEARELAERLAREALAEAARLRGRRRTAYHAATAGEEVAPFAVRVRTRADLARATERIEAELARRLRTALDARPELAARLQREPVLAGFLERLPAGDDGTAAGEGGGDPVERLRAFTEQCFEFYDRVFATATTEDTMLEAQERERLCLALLHALEALAADEGEARPTAE